MFYSLKKCCYIFTAPTLHNGHLYTADTVFCSQGSHYGTRLDCNKSMSGNTHHKHSHQDEADSHYDSKGNHVQFIIPYWWILLSSNIDSTATVRVK